MSSVLDIANKNARKTARRIGVFGFTVLLAAWTAYQFFALPRQAEAMLRAFHSTLANMIILGDVFAIEREISSFTDSGAFGGVWVFDHSQPPFLIAHRSAEEKAPVEVWGEARVGFFIHGFLPYVYVEDSIEHAMGTVGHILVAQALPWRSLAWWMALFCMVACGVTLLLSSSHARLARELLAPFVKLAQVAKDGQVVPHAGLGDDAESFDEAREVYARLKKAQAQQEEAARNRAVAQTVQMVAHDVRRPFTTIRALLMLLKNAKSHASTAALVDRYVPVIDAAVASVDSMIGDIMAFGGECHLHQVKVAIDVLMSEALRLIFSNTQNAHKDIAIDYQPSGGTYLHVDRERTIRIFANILANAAEAVDEGGRIWVSSITPVDGTHTPGYCHIVIGNSGSTIADEEREKIFEPFYTRGKKSGSGLGLAICRKFVRAHGGDVFCRSGDGVEFILTLPLAQACVAAKPEAPAVHS